MRWNHFFLIHCRGVPGITTRKVGLFAGQFISNLAIKLLHMESVNLKKMSQILNISISAVSKALKDSHDIGMETKQRVLTLAHELNYQPNLYASSLRRAKSKTIALIIPKIDNNFFTLAINGIESVAQEKGYHVLIYLTHEDFLKETALVKTLYNGRVDGLLMSISSTTSDVQHLEDVQAKGLPLVFFDRVCEDLNTYSITTDDYESAYEATTHLAEQGCRKIAHLMISNNLSIGKKRRQGYLDALRAKGLCMDEALLVHCNDDETDYELIKRLLQEKKPDGIFSSIESFALTTYEACQHLGLVIPGDVKVISFSNLKTASLLKPSLTTIMQPAFEIGREAATTLFKALEKKHFQLRKENVIIKSILVKRESTATS